MTFIDFMESDAIVMDLDSTDREGVLKEMVQGLCRAGRIKESHVSELNVRGGNSKMSEILQDLHRPFNPHRHPI